MQYQYTAYSSQCLSFSPVTAFAKDNLGLWKKTYLVFPINLVLIISSIFYNYKKFLYSFKDSFQEYPIKENDPDIKWQIPHTPIYM